MMTGATTHVVLLGDSIFDNSRYTRGEPDVVTHLRGVLPAGAQATLLAVDGTVTRSMMALAVLSGRPWAGRQRA
jgi:hypothetical protein